MSRKVRIFKKSNPKIYKDVFSVDAAEILRQKDCEWSRNADGTNKVESTFTGVTSNGVNLQTFKVAELCEMATEAELPLAAGMKKIDIIKALLNIDYQPEFIAPDEDDDDGDEEDDEE